MHRILTKLKQTSNIVHTSLQNGIPNKKKIVIDYSSPNVAKAFHIGNLRSTLIGNFVSNINKAAGNDVVGLNYIGDWGTQFGILLQPFLNEHGIVKHFESLTKKDKMKYMTDLYVEYTKLCKEDPEIKEKAKETFKNLELYFSGDTQIVNDNLRAQIKLFERIRYASIDYLEEFYTKLNVTFDVWTGESNIISEAHKVTNEIIGKGLTEVTADGLTIVRRKNSKEFATIRKSDGASLYLTRDIASILNREKLYEADEYLYVVDRAQLGHFNSVKDVVVQYGRPDLAAKVKHLAFGRVRGLSTRLGKSTSVDDILEKGTQLSLQFLKESPTIKVDNDLELCTIAEELAISTIKINEYQRKVTSEYDFSFDDAFKIKKRNALFFQTKFSRLNSLIENNVQYQPHLSHPDFKFDLNVSGDALNNVHKLMTLLSKLDQTLLKAYQDLEPSIIVVYLNELSTLTGTLTNELRVSGSDLTTGSSRLLLFMTIHKLMSNLMELLGVKLIIKM